MILLEVIGVSRFENDNLIVKNINFSQEVHQKIAIAGETGAGKTSLLKIIAGLLQPTTGKVLFEGRRVENPFEKLIPGHPHIACLSQHFELRNNYRVEEELESKSKLSDAEANTIYEVCRINHLLKRKTDQLSGGERQRIVLARLLTTLPKLLLLDEPFSNLDAVHKKIIKSVLDDITSRLHITCILVSHDAPDILSWADKILLMREGEIIQEGSPEKVYRYPVDEYCAGLLGEYNLAENKQVASILINPGNTIGGKRLLIRPEHIIVSSGNNGKGISGIIQKKLFWGSYYTIDVEAAGQLLRAKIQNDHFSIGEKVSLSAHPDDVWYI